MRNKPLIGFAAVFALVLVSQSAVRAATVTDLYNTGMSSNWTAGTQTPIAGTDPQSVNKVTDPHWDVVSPSTTDFAAVTLKDGAFPFPVSPSTFGWMPDLTASGDPSNVNVIDSQWISTDALYNPNNTGVSGGTYVFETTFTLPSSATSISISGWFKSATDVIGYQLNGGSIIPGFSSPNDALAGVPAHAFSVTGSGGTTNVLKFYVNRQGPGDPGLRVQFSGATATFAVPEPSTACLAALGLIGFGVVRLRRRFSASVPS